jgi:hypothetical protein
MVYRMHERTLSCYSCVQLKRTVMRYRFLPFLLFQTRPKRNGVKTGHASCPPKFLDCASFREIFDCTERGTRLSMPRSVLASCSLNSFMLVE